MTNLVVVDVQPLYDSVCRFIAPRVMARLNALKGTNNVALFYYVDFDDDRDGFVREELFGYCLEHGLDPDVLDQIRFECKDYGFLREWMDRGECDEAITTAIKLLRQDQVRTVHDLSDEAWLVLADNWLGMGPDEQDAAPMLYLPHWEYEALQHFQDATLIGGGLDECLREIKLLASGIGVDLHTDTTLCY